MTCPELERELNTLHEDPMTQHYGIGSEMSPLVIEQHRKRHGCRPESAWESGEPSGPIPGSPLPRSSYAKPAPTITQSQLYKEPNEGGTLYTAEASMLGLRPGSWPKELEILMDPHGMEPAMPETFLLIGLDREHGEIWRARYATRLGQTSLLIFND